jgi:hypothetical protein
MPLGRPNRSDPERGGVLVIGTACLIALSVPTLRAARIDPIAPLGKD